MERLVRKLSPFPLTPWFVHCKGSHSCYWCSVPLFFPCPSHLNTKYCLITSVMFSALTLRTRGGLRNLISTLIQALLTVRTENLIAHQFASVPASRQEQRMFSHEFTDGIQQQLYVQENVEFKCGFTVQGCRDGTNEAFTWPSSAHVPVSFFFTAV